MNFHNVAFSFTETSEWTFIMELMGSYAFYRAEWAYMALFHKQYRACFHLMLKNNGFEFPVSLSQVFGFPCDLQFHLDWCSGFHVT
jgi:hypothetical protein